MKNILLSCFMATIVLSSCTKEDDLIPENKIETTEKTIYTVSYDQAMQTLQAALSEMDGIETRGVAGQRKITSHYTVGQPVGETITRSANGETPDPYVHIFNFEEEQGYAIISGDKRTVDIFAITDTGSLEEGREVDNPGLILFLTNAETYYFSAIENYKEEPATRAAWSEYSPWSTVTYTSKGVSFNDWSSSYPYYNLLGYVNGMKSYAHPAQTATAMLMAFHNWPTSNDDSSTRYYYNWSEMSKHRPKENYTTNSNAYTEIARLYQQIGASANLAVTYSAGSTSANSENIPRTLRNFRYKNGGTHGSYNETTVFNELRSGYAVVASGFAYKTVTKKKILGITRKTITSYSGYHAWLLDNIIYRYRVKTDYNNYTVTGTSVESQYLVRCNWGRSGMDNGYYMSQAFDSYSGPITTRTESASYYQYKIEAVTGIRKP